MLIDAHVHLQDPAIIDRLDEVMATCQTEGIELLLCNGTRPSDWSDVAAIASRYTQVVPCYAVHPWYVHEAGEGWETELRDFLSRRASAVGECGIDRWIEPRDEPLQERIFRRHLQIAAELGRPCMVHCLRAWGWLMDVLASEEKLPPALLMHSYGGSAELVEPLCRYNAYFSISGSIFEAKRQKLRDAAMTIPLDRLLVETDAPALLPPEQLRRYHVTTGSGEMQNHPANLPMVYQGLAELLGVPLHELKGQVEANAREFLGDLFDVRR